jgi:hypothetical protein
MTEFIYRPPNSNPPIVREAAIGFKFAQRAVILDPWWIVGGNKWTRTLFRLKHPIVYSKRGIKNLYRRIKQIFVKEHRRQCNGMDKS